MTKKTTKSKCKATQTQDYTITSYSIPAGYTIERIRELEKNSTMLGQIANVVFDFCEGEETTLQGVIKAVATLRDLQAKELWDRWEKEDK
jgi:hypothetical protein